MYISLFQICSKEFSRIFPKACFSLYTAQQGNTLPSQLIIVSVHGSIQPTHFFCFVETTVNSGLSGIHALSLSSALWVVSKTSLPISGLIFDILILTPIFFANSFAAAISCSLCLKTWNSQTSLV